MPGTVMMSRQQPTPRHCFASPFYLPLPAAAYSTLLPFAE